MGKRLLGIARLVASFIKAIIRFVVSFVSGMIAIPLEVFVVLLFVLTFPFFWAYNQPNTWKKHLDNHFTFDAFIASPQDLAELLGLWLAVLGWLSVLVMLIAVY